MAGVSVGKKDTRRAEREDTMNRREFLGRIRWAALTAASLVIAAGTRQSVDASGKGQGKSSGGGNQSQQSGSTGNNSNISGTDLGSGRFKANNPTQKGKTSGNEPGSPSFWESLPADLQN
jgi:hypothetical protein